MGEIIESPYELIYDKKSFRHWSFDAAKNQYMKLKGEGPCLHQATISFKGQVLFESFPIIVDGMRRR